MPAFIAPAPLPGDVNPEALLRAVFEVSLTGFQLLRPIYGPDNSALVDFAFAYTNPAGLRMIGLAELPSGTLVSCFPHTLTAGVFAYYQQAFATDEPLASEANYQADGVDNYFRFSARRSGEYLLVSFTDTNDQPRSAVEQALRASQAQEQAARAEAERQRALLYGVFEQAPAMICILRGPQHVFEFANAPYRALLGERPLVGRPFAEAVPELAGQGILEPLNEVYRTGRPFYASEQLAQLDHDNSNPPELEKRYYNLVWQARRDLAGAVDGVLVFAYDVTPQAEARQQVQELNEELATINEELRASNEEHLAANGTLGETQQQLHQLNQALEAARAATERERVQLQALLMQAPVAIGLFEGEDLRVSAINPRMAEQLGYAPAQLLGQPLFERAPELQGQGFEELMQQVQATRVPYVGQEVAATVQRHGQAQLVYFNFVYQPLYDAHDHVMGVINVAVDVTEQVLARQQLEQLNQELEARVQERTQVAEQALATAERERAQLQALLAQAPVAIGLLEGEDLHITAANAQMAAIWGRTPAQVLGRPFMSAVPELRGQRFDELMRQVMRTQVPVRGTETPATMLRDGLLQTTYYDFVYHPLYDADGRALGVINVAVEVTAQVLARQQVQALNEELATINEELRATNEELQQSNHQLTRTNVDLDTFVYTASHDLKAPITNLEGLLTALRQELPPAVQQADVTSQLLRLMQDSVERFRTTINQLTDISRLQHEQNQPAEHVPLAAVVEAVRLDLLPLLSSTHAQLLVDIRPDLTVLFSPKNLRSVVYNLLSNALKYHQPGRPPLVQLHAQATGAQAVLTVADNGLGLSEYQQSRLFELFQRLHTHVEGTGVGLYMVKRLVENGGGTITVQSEVGVGTAFQVTFATRWPQ